MYFRRSGYELSNSAVLCDNIDEEYTQRVNFVILINIIFFVLIGFLVTIEEEARRDRQGRRNINNREEREEINYQLLYT